MPVKHLQPYKKAPPELFLSLESTYEMTQSQEA
jgi:hypothetical protein